MSHCKTDRKSTAFVLLFIKTADDINRFNQKALRCFNGVEHKESFGESNQNINIYLTSINGVTPI